MDDIKNLSVDVGGRNQAIDVCPTQRFDYNGSMTGHEESMEIGIAAGLDIPTAMVISERGEKLPTGKVCNRTMTIAIMAGLIATLLVHLLE
jgi:hypothetical protein